MVAKYHDMGFNDREIVALSGCHTIGFAHKERSGFEGRFVMNPYVFDNSYYKEALKSDADSKYLRTNMENGMRDDPQLSQIMEEYAQDQDVFFEDYAAVHTKMSELGCDNLFSEIPEPSF